VFPAEIIIGMSDMNAGQCPNCGGDDFARFPSGRQGGLFRGAFRTTHLTRLVCLRCGLVRDWVATRDDLDRLRRKYGRR
jgi:ribosomal protein S27AE